MPTDVNEVLQKLKKELKDAEIRLGSDPRNIIKRLSTGVPPLDDILGGGLPFGAITLIKGDFSSGKTFLCQKIIAEAQRQGLLCAYIDVEKTFHQEWFSTTGVSLESLIVAKPVTGEQAFDIAIALIDAGVKVIVLDSVAALLPSSEEEAGMEKQQPGALARLVNRGLKKVVQANIKENKCIFIILNQVRMGLMAGGNVPIEALPAGKGQWGFASIVVGASRGGWIKEGANEVRVGFNMKLKTEKNKTFPPQKVCSIPFRFEGGVLDFSSSLLDVAVDVGIIKQKGAFYECEFLPEGRMRGKQAVIDFLSSNPDVASKIKERVSGSNGDPGTQETTEIPE